MNQKLVHLIAAQFGIIIGLLSWMIHSHFQNPQSSGFDEPDDLATASAQPFTPVTNLDYPRAYPVSYRQPQPIQQQQQQQLPATQYYDQSATEPDTNSYAANESLISTTPNYYDPVRLPSYTATDPGYDNVYDPYLYSYGSPVQNVQNVVFFNSRDRSQRRHQFGMDPRHCPDREGHRIGTTPLPPVAPPRPANRPRQNIVPPQNVKPGFVRQPNPAPRPQRPGSPVVSSKNGRPVSFAP